MALHGPIIVFIGQIAGPFSSSDRHDAPGSAFEFTPNVAAARHRQHDGRSLRYAASLRGVALGHDERRCFEPACLAASDLVSFDRS